MKKHIAEKLSEAADLDSLQSLILDLCEPFGNVIRVDLIPDSNHESVVCRLELESLQDRGALLNEFGGMYMGSGMYFTILRRQPAPERRLQPQAAEVPSR